MKNFKLFSFYGKFHRFTLLFCSRREKLLFQAILRKIQKDQNEILGLERLFAVANYNSTLWRFKNERFLLDLHTLTGIAPQLWGKWFILQKFLMLIVSSFFLFNIAAAHIACFHSKIIKILTIKLQFSTSFGKGWCQTCVTEVELHKFLGTDISHSVWTTGDKEYYGKSLLSIVFMSICCPWSEYWHD